jgi:aminomethyltransferase
MTEHPILEQHTTERAPDYDAALSGVVYWDESQAGRILMRGRDRAELLQRLSTNDIVRLRPGQGAQTVLTSPIGRIIDLLTVHALDDALLVVTSAGQGPAVFGHLRKNIFFNDQVTLEPAGRSHAQLALFGPQAEQALRASGGASELAGLAMHHHIELVIAGGQVRVARRAPIGGAGFTLYVPAQQLESVRAALEEAGALALTAVAYEILRVEQGIPAYGHELGLEYIPLETGLNEAICFTKGCYVGQEIIARMESRNRMAKQLRGLRLDAPAEAPGKLSVEGKEAGDLTSAVVSPRFGPIALAYVRSAHAAPGTQVGVAQSDVQAQVVDLPFSESGAAVAGGAL